MLIRIRIVATLAVAALLTAPACDTRESHRSPESTTEVPATTASAPPVAQPPDSPARQPSPPASNQRCTPREMTLCPVDEAPRDPGFAAYRTRLLEAIDRKDETMLLPLLADDIRVSFGGDGGTADFQKHWKTSSPDSPLWSELGTIVRSGGSFSSEGSTRMFWAPYVYSRWPDDVDAFEYVAVVRSGVAFRNRPDDAPATRTLDWSIVRVLDPASAADAAWRHVRAADGTEGWVSANDLRSPIGYRAGFQQVNGEWRMTALVAGD